MDTLKFIHPRFVHNICAIVQVYIVYMGSSRDSERDFIVSSHVELLSSVLGRYGVVLIIESVRLSRTSFFLQLFSVNFTI